MNLNGTDKQIALAQSIIERVSERADEVGVAARIVRAIADGDMAAAEAELGALAETANAEMVESFVVAGLRRYVGGPVGFGDCAKVAGKPAEASAVIEAFKKAFYA